MTQYIVFDDKGVIHQSSDYDAALQEFEETTEFTGDLHFVKELMVRR
jgi:hypothetical protein